tara:strand:+ start:1425 stop:1613 length:189 start_codon:yes stop_codon:yes gene_type:complete
MVNFFESIKNNFVKRVRDDEELERNKKYEVRWVWYHTILALELLTTNVLLIWILIKIYDLHT